MTRNRIISAAVLAMSALAATAQNTYTGYFNDGYLYRHEMNPAISNEQSYVSMPILGNLNIGARGSFGMKDLLYVRNGQTVTFMNPAVSLKDAMSGFHNKNRLTTDLRLQILGIGFKTKHSYHTIGIDVRNTEGLCLPGDLFHMAKEGLTNNTYKLDNLNVEANAFAEVSYGYSRKVDENLEVGGKLKILLGLGHANLKSDNTVLTLADDHWDVDANIEGNVNVAGSSFVYDTDDNGYPTKEIKDFDYDTPGLAGVGAALDLGATYKWQDFKFGLSVLDFGFIKWKNTLKAECKGSFTTDDYTFNVDGDAANNFEDEFERFGDDLADAFTFTGSEGGSNSRMLGATINASAEYTLPMYKKVSFGLLSTTKIMGKHTWTEARISANYAPCNFFSLSLSGVEGTFGPGFGWMINLHPKGFNLFAGMDYLGTPFTKQGIPAGKSMNMNLGINFPF